jgi:hypothetical protein
MSTSLNLTLKRGPSVWEHQSSWPSNWPAYGVVAGVMFATLVTAPRSKRPWLMGLALGIAGAWLLTDGFASSLQASARQFRVLRGGHNDRAVDRASEESFPASDPTQY